MSKKRYQVLVSFNLTDEMYEALERTKNETGMFMSNLVRNIVKFGLRRLKN